MVRGQGNISSRKGNQIFNSVAEFTQIVETPLYNISLSLP